MAVTNSMFIFEVVVENVQSLVESRYLVIRSEFADIFSLELKDPKQLHIVMPEPLPLPPPPPGKKKKGKGKKKAKPKPKKGKKGKKGKKKKGMVEEPPKEPPIQSGQSILFSSNPEFLIQSMKKCPIEVSLWSKEEHLIFIGSGNIPWDPIFITYLERIIKDQPAESVTVKDEYNVFQEGSAKRMAKLGIQVKLSYLGDRITTSFRTLSEDPIIKKCLYTGVNNKSTSYMCTMKTTDEDFETNSIKIDCNYIVDNPRKVAYADYKNAPGANLTFFSDGDYCCMGSADKPPESKYKAPQTCPDIDFIVDYVRKIILSCNDNMRMLTPRPTITPRVKATDIDKLCYCRETKWPEGEFAERFKKEAQSGPCPMCMDTDKNLESLHPATFDISNIRGPCGKPDCRIARDIRAYIENLVVEDNKVFDINEVIGPCGSKSCTLAEKIQEFLRHEGDFIKGQTLEGLSTQCACIETMKNALARRTSCESICSYECEETSDSEVITCEGKACPHATQKVYNVYYFTVEYNFDKSGGSPGSSSPKEDKSIKFHRSTKNSSNDDKSSKYKYCSSSCPSLKASDNVTCSKSVCSGNTDMEYTDKSKCKKPECQKFNQFPPSPADSNVVIDFNHIHNLCCVKSCEVALKVKDFISDVMISKNKSRMDPEDDPCYCDCVCDFNFTKRTTYCPVCGGYECLGDDLKDQPEYIKPLPCPIYHKTYDKKYFSTRKLPDEDENDKKPESAASAKSSKTGRSAAKKEAEKEAAEKRSPPPPAHPQKIPATSKAESDRAEVIEKDNKVEQDVTKLENITKKKSKKRKKKSNRKVPKKPQYGYMYPYPNVPKEMGWNWAAEDIPGLEPRPDWRPGAANKMLVRKYRAVREGMDVIAKKKRALMQKKKKSETKPTLTVIKHDGEYTVQMEVFKKYSKERLLFQNPYDDKPPVIYTIGKTDEEKRTLQRQRERRERREIRRKSRLIQSTFRDKCQEICLKAYNQAIGVLPLPNANNPDCPCATASGQELPPPVDSCSCSECGTITTSDTDNDDWIIEFSPPAARYDSKAKHPPSIVDAETQYTYLDYKVKLLDKSGNQVPRFFIGPDGKEECSDLGGFWGSNNVWLEINKDGFIAPDNRWAPMNFIGPDGMFYSAEEGSFTDNTGQTLRIGVDGYINKEGKWTAYKKDAKGSSSPVITSSGTKAKGELGGSNIKGNGKSRELVQVKSNGDKKTSPDSKVDKAKCQCQSINKGKNPTVMRAAMNYEKKNKNTRTPVTERLKTDTKKLEKYKEIMQRLQVYEDFFDQRPLMMTNRATQNSTHHPKTSTPADPRSMAAIRSTTTRSYRSSTTVRS